MVGMVLLRALNRDITKYNAVSSSAYDLDLDPADQIQDDSGWKLLHGEVFRPPKRRMWLCITVGTGAQVSAMFGVTLRALSILPLPVELANVSLYENSFRPPRLPQSQQPRRLDDGHDHLLDALWRAFVSPLRGSRLLTDDPLRQFVAGYVSSRLYVTMNGDAIRKNIIYTALVFPSCVCFSSDSTRSSADRLSRAASFSPSSTFSTSSSSACVQPAPYPSGPSRRSARCVRLVQQPLVQFRTHAR